jgi:hypothetical protein
MKSAIKDGGDEKSARIRIRFKAFKDPGLLTAGRWGKFARDPGADIGVAVFNVD